MSGQIIASRLAWVLGQLLPKKAPVQLEAIEVMRHRIGFSALATLLFAVLPTTARADSFTYTFTSSVGHVSFTEPSLITTDQTISILPFKLQGVTFVYASVIFFSANDLCFEFATANVSGNCLSGSETAPFSTFGAEFLDATSVGTFAAVGGFCSRSDLGEPCIFAPAPGWTLTISHGAPVPEPSMMVLFGNGVLGILALIRRKNAG